MPLGSGANGILRQENGYEYDYVVLLSLLLLTLSGFIEVYIIVLCRLGLGAKLQTNGTILQKIPISAPHHHALVRCSFHQQFWENRHKETGL